MKDKKQNIKKCKVSGCHDCPFLHSEYDDYALGDSTMDFCVLAKFKNFPEYIIETHNHMGINPKIKTPDWCPIKTKSITIEFKEK